jgi:hypothetical protein
LTGVERQAVGIANQRCLRELLADPLATGLDGSIIEPVKQAQRKEVL